MIIDKIHLDNQIYFLKKLTLLEIIQVILYKGNKTTKKVQLWAVALISHWLVMRF